MTDQLMRDARDPRLVAATVLLGRSGARSFQIRYEDSEDPVLWLAYAEWGDHGQEAAGALSPLTAVMRLLERVVDGGTCAHCQRPSAVTDDWTQTMPLNDELCWYQYDPELQLFRRGCENDDRWTAVGRNDPCPCGSGEKFKRCHGSGPRRNEAT